MRHLFRFGIVPSLLVAFLACDMEQELEQEIVGPEGGPKTAALTAEAEPETNEVIVIKGEEALLRRIEELKRSSPAFAAAAASIFDGPVTSGDRVVCDVRAVVVFADVAKHNCVGVSGHQAGKRLTGAFIGQVPFWSQAMLPQYP